MARLTQFGGATLPIPLSSDALQIDLLVVGGGGASNIDSYYGAASGGGGGGGGRVIESFGILVKKGKSYTVTVGSAGQNSSFSSLFAQAGGASALYLPSSSPAQVGGSGGGGGATPGTTIGASAIFPSNGTYTANSVEDTTFILSSGNPGGNGASVYGTGGGGGAGSKGGNAPGSNPPSTVPGECKGGSGVISTISGTSSYYGAGGGGYNGYPIYPYWYDSQGIGWRGANSGSGGSFPHSGLTPLSPQPALGQSGVVIVAYPSTYSLATTTGNPILYSASNPLGANATRTGYHVYEFAGSGTITFN